MTTTKSSQSGRHADEREDARLARAAADGSRAALEALFQRHRNAVYGVAYRVTGSRSDAEDVLQDVFVGLSRALRRYREQGSFDAWLRTVAARTALMKVRRRGRHPWEPLPEHLPSSEPGPERAIDRLVIRDALAEMPASLRTVFLLKEVDGYRHAEIAELLGIPPTACRVRLHRAWKFLEGRLGGLGS